jgi:hypothetical protein
METLSATLDRFERGQAVLRFTDGQQLILSKKHLPRSTKEGTLLNIEFFRAEDEEKRREKIARYLLEEILGSNDT